MTENGFVLLLCGLACLVATFLPGRYKLAAGRGAHGITVPPWLGRLWFLSIAAVLIYLSFSR